MYKNVPDWWVQVSGFHIPCSLEPEKWRQDIFLICYYLTMVKSSAPGARWSAGQVPQEHPLPLWADAIPAASH